MRVFNQVSGKAGVGMEFPKGQFWPGFLVAFLTLVLSGLAWAALSPLLLLLIVPLGLAGLAVANSFTLYDWETFISRKQLPAARAKLNEYANQLVQRRHEQKVAPDNNGAGFIGEFGRKIENEYSEAERFLAESKRLLDQLQAKHPAVPEGGLTPYVYGLWNGPREFGQYEQTLKRLVKVTNEGFQRYFGQADNYYAAMLKEIAAVPRRLAGIERVTRSTSDLYAPLLGKVRDPQLHDLLTRHEQALKYASARLRTTPQLHQVIGLDEERSRLEADQKFIEAKQTQLEAELEAAQRHAAAFVALENLQKLLPALDLARQEFLQTSAEFDLQQLRPALETLLSEFDHTAGRFQAGSLTLAELNGLGERAARLPDTLIACQQEASAFGADLQKKTTALKTSLKTRLEKLQSWASLKEEPAVQAVLAAVAQPDPAPVGWPNPQAALAVELQTIRVWAASFKSLQACSSQLNQQVEEVLRQDLQQLSNLRKQTRTAYDSLKQAWEVRLLSDVLRKEVEQLGNQRQQWENALARLRQEGNTVLFVRSEITRLLQLGESFVHQVGQAQRFVELEKRAAILDAEVTRLTTTNTRQESELETLKREKQEMEARLQAQKVEISALKAELAQSRAGSSSPLPGGYPHKPSSVQNSSSFESRRTKGPDKLISRN